MCRLDGLGVSTELPVRAHAVELDSSVYLDLPLDGTTEEQTHVVLPDLEPVGKLKCGMWTSFALATVLIVGAKFYFNNQVYIQVDYPRLSKTSYVWIQFFFCSKDL